jgi:crotonobetainyl-CoA:carnitine CoA-transferase CaiB-like acyl-CoA transferase
VTLALEGMKVLDLSRVLTGPYCTMMLADMGADVIKVEQPGTGDDTRQWGPPFLEGESTYFLSVNRNKRSLTLNLKHPEGQEVLLRLLRWADVLVENFRPGYLDRLGFGYERLREVNPGLVYCSISGFGATGPYRDKPGYDVLAQAMGGMMGVTGYEGAPPVKAGMSVADIGAGMFAAFGILAALMARQQTGRGQLVDTSLLESQLAWHTYLATAYFATGKVPRRLGSAHPSIAPYQAIRCRDGHVVVAVGNDSLWRKFCGALGLDDLGADPQWATNPQRASRREELITLLESRLTNQTMDELVRRCEESGVPAGPIYNLEQVYSDLHVLAREMVVQVEHPVSGPFRMTGIPVKLSDTPGAVRLPPPTLGQHTDEVLRALGYTAGQIGSLRENGAI